MRRSCSVVLGAGAIFACVSAADAWEVRIRYVQRVGNEDVSIPNSMLPYQGDIPVRVRVQIGVFNNATGPAPAGGVFGMLNVQFTSEGLSARRTPGRLPPFTFPSDGNGEPATEPFHALTNIDATVGAQTIVWDCTKGVPGPMPGAVIQGVNTFVSVMEFTVTPSDWPCFQPQFTLSGRIVPVASWSVDGTPVSPVCEPATPGSVRYVAQTLPSVRFLLQRLSFEIGSPGPVPPPPIYNCIGNWSRDLVLDSTDFFEYMEDFFAGDGDTDCSGTTTTEDFYRFLTLFLDNCGL